MAVDNTTKQRLMALLDALDKERQLQEEKEEFLSEFEERLAGRQRRIMAGFEELAAKRNQDNQPNR